MATHRLTFLYPHMFKASRIGDGSLISSTRAFRRKRAVSAAFSTATTRYQEEIAQRYGTAHDPQLPPPSMPPKPAKPTEDKSLAAAIETEVKAPPEPAQKKAETSTKPKEPPKIGGGTVRKEVVALSSSKVKEKEPTSPSPSLDLAKSSGGSPTSEQLEKRLLAQKSPGTEDKKITTPRPLETMFKIPAPTAEKPEEHKAPHMQAPPYVHHFDTYTLVRDLEKGGFPEEVSVTLMKAVRILLAANLDVAKEGLVGKSDVENETYLFRAACSELRTEILNARRASSAHRQTQLHHLQHSIDILSQRVSQESLTLKDDLRGMLNERRMATREQSQQRDSEISELNYRISARLIGDSKSNVEGLRWTLTRSSVLAIAAMAMMILGTLRLGSLRIHEREVEEKKMAAAAAHYGGNNGSGGGGGGGGGIGGGKTDGGIDGNGVLGNAGPYTVGSREMGTQTDDAALVNKGESMGYVSLG